MDEDEAVILAGATNRLTELYDIPLPSDKILAWIGLGNALAEVYGPRIIAVGVRRKAGRPKIVEGKVQGYTGPGPVKTPPTARDISEAIKESQRNTRAMNPSIFEDTPTIASF